MVAALSIMSNVPTAVIEQNMRDAQAEALLVFAKAMACLGNDTQHNDVGGAALSTFDN